jgi:putative hydrolase of the HAD superfamily
MAPVPAVFFDLDGTLIDDDASVRICMERTCHEFQACAPGFDRVHVARAYYELAGKFWLHRATSGLDDDREYRVALWGEALESCGIQSPGLAREFATFYGLLRRETAIAYDESASVLASLHSDYRLVLITNGPGEIQRNKLALAGLDSHFDAVFTSADIGAGKPDRIIFDAAIEAVDADPTRTWHIGDNLMTDVGGALGAGLKAAWLNRTNYIRLQEHPVPDAELKTLNEFAALLVRGASCE